MDSKIHGIKKLHELKTDLSNGPNETHGNSSESERADSKIDQALDASIKELQLLAQFYKQHGKMENAQEITNTVSKIRDKTNRQKLA